MEQDCQNTYHQNHSGLCKVSVDKYFAGDIFWSCDPCIKKKESSDQRKVLNDVGDNTTDNNKDCNNKDAESETRESLKILQFNADSISNKIEKLREAAVKH